ncbi:hypothetical protein [Micromonospora sp. NPDC047740]|uniref:hypothetical protein n=1 Tax=Micromonospora sp. NPDC047740 TaxID=3364254 RepID=UPI00371325BF
MIKLTINNYGPVIHGSADGAQMAWGNDVVHQTHSRSEQVTPEFELLAQAVTRILENLAAAGLHDEDRADAEAAAREILDEVGQATPDRRRARRAVNALKGLLAPIATGAATGAAMGAQEWARAAIDQLGVPF